MARKPKRITRTLFEENYYERVLKQDEYALPYPMTVKRFNNHYAKLFGGYETCIFDDILDLEPNMYYGARTIASGPLVVQVSGKRPRDLSRVQRFDFPEWIENDAIGFLSAKAKGILIVEHSSVFGILRRSKEFRSLSLILICGVGIPRIQTRRILHRLSTELKLPVYLLSDNTTWTYFMFSVLKRGLMAPHAESPYLAVKNLRYLGLRAGENAKFVSDKKLIPWKPHWTLRIKALRKYKCFAKAPWQKEFDRFVAQQFAVYLLPFRAARGVENFVTDWLRPKIENRDWLT